MRLINASFLLTPNEIAASLKLSGLERIGGLFLDTVTTDGVKAGLYSLIEKGLAEQTGKTWVLERAIMILIHEMAAFTRCLKCETMKGITLLYQCESMMILLSTAQQVGLWKMTPLKNVSEAFEHWRAAISELGPRVYVSLATPTEVLTCSSMSIDELTAFNANGLSRLLMKIESEERSHGNDNG